MSGQLTLARISDERLECLEQQQKTAHSTRMPPLSQVRLHSSRKVVKMMFRATMS
jgi:hypothetical protein